MAFEKYFKGKHSLDLNWDYIYSIPEFAQLEKCEQSKKWHGEGNAMNHTKKCLEWAYKQVFAPWESLERSRTKIMCVLFHDIGKCVSTVFKKDDWHAYGHEITGEKIARRILWDEPIELRETICYCVRWHMEPLNIMEKHKNKLTLIARMALDCSLFYADSYLVFTKMADIEGSVPSDSTVHDKTLKELNEFWFVLSRMGDFLGEKPTERAMTNRRLLYDIVPVIPASHEQTVTVMVGLPGAGKDTWIADNTGPWTKVVCRDDIREELGFTKPGEKAILSREKEDKVTEVFNEKLREYVANGYNVIINNINLRKVYRDSYKEIIKDPSITWKYVYIEAPTLADNFKRREGQIPPENYYGMIEKFDFPRYDEYDVIEIHKQK